MSDHVFTEAELAALCREWQDRLSLQPWHITVVIERRERIDANVQTQGAQASCDQNTCSRRARIHIGRLEDWPLVDAVAPDDPLDMERNLVHELLHIVLANWPSPETSVEKRLKEQSIEDLARALVGLKRDLQTCAATVLEQFEGKTFEAIEQELLNRGIRPDSYLLFDLHSQHADRRRRELAPRKPQDEPDVSTP